MRVVLFCHSIASDWNHGNAHFLRGVVRELQERGHEVDVYEPRDGWSRSQLVREHGAAPLEEFRRAFPTLRSRLYRPDELDADAAADGADLVLVHEWTDPAVVARLGEARRRSPSFRLLFHDTHHRAVTAPAEMQRFDLAHYDGVLAFGETLRRIYLEREWAARAWTWHEAADVRVFAPRPDADREGELVWIGNWGDGERSAELQAFLLGPARRLALSGSVYGVRYPREGRDAIERSGLAYRGWLANHRVPGVFAAHAVTVHVPRGPYVRALPGIPTIRPFEALACGIPLVSAPWDDVEELFRPGDFLVARNGDEMAARLHEVLRDPELAAELSRRGRETILARHTCAHRVDELLGILVELGVAEAVAA
jgi:spore maturation protein CgeB